MMKKNVFLLLFFMVAVIPLSIASNISISGKVTIGENRDPLPSHKVTFLLSGPALEVLQEVTTGEDGTYQLEFKLDPVQFDSLHLTGKVDDPCLGTAISKDIAFSSNQDVNFSMDFSVCNDTDFPRILPFCQSLFFYDVIDRTADNWTVQFQDLSNSSSPVIEWQWEFGDGNSSSETAPIHIYETEGLYQVSLRILTEDCENIVSMTINIGNDPCDCSPEFTPVCGFNQETGDTLLFINPCLAECIGFPTDELFDCFDNCYCPAIYDPVCAIGDDGVFRQFANSCQAACNGYEVTIPCDSLSEPCVANFIYDYLYDDDESIQFSDASISISNPIDNWIWNFGDGNFAFEPAPIHQYMEPGSYEVTLTVTTADSSCTSSITKTIEAQAACYCDAEYDPVCVQLGNGYIRQFPNSCTAICRGFSEEDFVDCESRCDCPEYYSPVCVYVDSTRVEFDNICFANCAGFSEFEVFSCYPDSNCICPEIIDPVCVIGADGRVLRFINECEANCRGFAETFNCDSLDVCIADFEYDLIDPLGENTVILHDISYTSMSPTITWVWDLGDGGTSEEPVVIHNYSEPGTYEVTLSITTQYGCTSSTTKTIVVRSSDCFCPAIYDPVCVQIDSNQIFTFSNACEAICSGYSEADFVSCDGNGHCACPEYYDPVCVYNQDSTLLEFPNPCFAECEGYTEADFVDCDAGQCACPRIYDPVCVIDPTTGLQRMFSNSCLAECAGFGDAEFVECDTSCICPDIYDPVCVYTPSGGRLEFSNACEALCAGYDSTIIVPCDTTDCICTDEFDPVCVRTSPSGPVVRFSNLCEALCAGFDSTQIFPCPDGCVCPAIYDPVCIYTATGEVIRFSNECEALCAGYDSTLIQSCEEDCICPEIYDPVCVRLDDGVVITFQNSCYAICEGYTEDQFIDCGSVSCACPLNIDPVCVIDSNNQIRTFVNRCVAECFGYTNFIDCENRGASCFANFDWFILDDDIIETISVQFEDQSFTDSTNIVEWNWEFGDGTISQEQNPIHEYLRPGGYEVVLTIQTDDGCTAVTSRYLFIRDEDIINGPQCQAMFVFEQDETELTTFYFQNVSIGAFESLEWNFGDGNTSSELNPTHTYQTPGAYMVTLSISSAYCQSSFRMILTTDENIIYENDCRALFLPIVSNDSTIHFINLSSEDAATFEWDFGDGETSNEFVVSHIYAAPGIYQVSLTITTEDGCTNTFKATIELGNTEAGTPGDEIVFIPEFNTTTSTNSSNYSFNGTWKVYPNPVRSILTAEFESPLNGKANFTLFNVNGSIMIHSELDINIGLNQETLEVNNLPSGIYWLQLRMNQYTRTEKVIITK